MQDSKHGQDAMMTMTTYRTIRGHQLDPKISAMSTFFEDKLCEMPSTAFFPDEFDERRFLDFFDFVHLYILFSEVSAPSVDALE